MDTDVLNFLISNGMIDLLDVRQKMKDMERQPYIWPFRTNFYPYYRN